MFSLYALYQMQANSKKQKNECGGILAFISSQEDAKKFCQQNAHVLQKTPYQ
jgi:hypothetical protein